MLRPLRVPNYRSDIFRMKGVLSIKGEPRRFVFQGVHMLFDGRADREWGGEPRLKLDGGISQVAWHPAGSCIVLATENGGAAAFTEARNNRR